MSPFPWLSIPGPEYVLHEGYIPRLLSQMMVDQYHINRATIACHKGLPLLVLVHHCLGASLMHVLVHRESLHKSNIFWILPQFVFKFLIHGSVNITLAN